MWEICKFAFHTQMNPFLRMAVYSCDDTSTRHHRGGTHFGKLSTQNCILLQPYLTVDTFTFMVSLFIWSLPDRNLLLVPMLLQSTIELICIHYSKLYTLLLFVALYNFAVVQPYIDHLWQNARIAFTMCDASKPAEMHGSYQRLCVTIWKTEFTLKTHLHWLRRHKLNMHINVLMSNFECRLTFSSGLSLYFFNLSTSMPK